jgi:hypothetical protein
MAAKIFFRRDEPLTRDNVCKIQLDSVQKPGDHLLPTVAITLEQFNQLKDGTKEFTLDENGNIDSITNAPGGATLDEYTSVLKTQIYMAGERMREREVVGEAEEWEAYRNDLNAIDTSSITFPLDKPCMADIKARCPNYPEKFYIEN